MLCCEKASQTMWFSEMVCCFCAVVIMVTGCDTVKVVPALASGDVTTNVTDALVDGWRERGEERVMGDASEEKVPSAISSVDAEEEWVSASESVIHGISLHPHVENALPDGDA